MAIKHNQKLPHNHFRKDWQRRVKCHFDQAGKKVSRRIARASKVASLAPRPVDKLRPVVRCPTIKYNRKLRAGRGFTLDELKAAGIPRLLAPTIGISVDSRRKNLSEESLSLNVARLKAYKDKLILFPRKVGKPKKGDNPADLEKTKTHGSTAAAFPFVPIDQEIKEIKKSDMPKPIEGGAYFTLRMARSDKRQKGGRDHRKAAKAEAEANKK